MKHNVKITILLISMFFIAQLVGIYVASVYSPQVVSIINETTGETINVTQYNLPYGVSPPQDVSPTSAATSIIIALFIAVVLMLLLMRLQAETFLRLWFFIVITIGIALALNAVFFQLPYASLVALIIAIPLGIMKVFKRNIIIHNLTEILIYPGIASVFIPILDLWSVMILLILISVYDIYAVWHAGFMQKMAKYQIEKVRVFSGFFIPYVRPEDRNKIQNVKQQTQALKSSKKTKEKKVQVNLAILGGGDVIFPIILAGVVLHTFGLIPALIVAVCATLALAGLFYISEKGKFYPAMPFISAGCFVALAVIYLINLL